MMQDRRAGIQPPPFKENGDWQSTAALVPALSDSTK